MMITNVIFAVLVSSAASSPYDGSSSASPNPWFFGTTCSSFYDDPAAEAIQEAVSSVVEGDCDLANPLDYPPPYQPVDGEQFDFIIVGAGSAGCVLANRLSEISGWRILLIEAGGYPTKTSEIPNFGLQVQMSEIDWQYKTNSEEPNCLAMNRRQCNWPRGKVLGGSSAINGMQYMRGNPRDYDGWEAEGCTGWGYEDVLPYFKKSEDIRASEVFKTPDYPKYHGIGGNLKIEEYNTCYENSIANILSSAAAELGYFINHDSNGRVQSGFSKFQATLENGRRCSTAKAFLTNISQRQNLKVATRSLVSKVIIDEVSKTAYGVEILDKTGQRTKVLARKEVILSAGVINTPQLLMLSGIGPGRHLSSFGIQVISDLPVGLNLQDHAFTQGLVLSFDYPNPNENRQEELIRFLNNESSRMSSVGMDSFNLFINSDTPTIDYPDSQLLFSDFAKNDTSTLERYLQNAGYVKGVRQQFVDINYNSFILILRYSNLSPYSRGRIELQSTDPTMYPNIITGYFSDPRDVDHMIKVYNFYYNLANTQTIKSIGGRLHEIKFPACLKFKFQSREYVECFLRHITTTQYHAVGSCKMGDPNRPDTVVDSNLRVKGVKGLRVIDSSIMPTIIRGNPNGPSIMIGEKGSDLVKKTWVRKRSPTSNRINPFKNTLIH